MLIELIKQKDNGIFDWEQSITLLVNSEEMAAPCEGMQPEDAVFHKCLEDPLSYLPYISKIYEAGRKNEELNFKYYFRCQIDFSIKHELTLEQYREIDCCKKLHKDN